MATTTIDSSANKKAFYSKLKRVRRSMNLPNADPDFGLYVFDSSSITVSATEVGTQNNEKFSLQFPENSFLLQLKVVASDMDDSTDLLLDINIEDEDGNETTLINAMNAQSAVIDELDAGAAFTDVSSSYLGFKVQATGGSVKAGTIRYYGLLYMGDMISGL